MKVKTKSKLYEAYAVSLDRRLIELRKKQGDIFLLAHSLWECIQSMTQAINYGVKELEYDIYYELIERKAIEFGLANFEIGGDFLKNHLNKLSDLIRLQKKFNYS